MTATRNPLQVLKEAKQIARDHGCFVVEKGGKYLVFRVTPTGNAYLGSRGTPQTLRAHVCKLTNFH
jgi:hypothetical protein